MLASSTEMNGVACADGRAGAAAPPVTDVEASALAGGTCSLTDSRTSAAIREACWLQAEHE